MSNKQEVLTEQIVEFEKSARSTEDYMNLFVKVVSSTRQGSGLVWEQVEDSIKNAILIT
jgi:hypothetical protein